MDDLEDLQTDRTNIYFYIFTTMEDESNGWDPVKLALAPRKPPFPAPPTPTHNSLNTHTYTQIHARLPSNSSLTVPRR